MIDGTFARFDGAKQNAADFGLPLGFRVQVLKNGRVEAVYGIEAEVDGGAGAGNFPDVERHPGVRRRCGAVWQHGSSPSSASLSALNKKIQRRG